MYNIQSILIYASLLLEFNHPCMTNHNYNQNVSVPTLPSEIIEYIGSFLHKYGSSNDLITFAKTSKRIKVIIDDIILHHINTDYESILNISQQLTAKDILKQFYHVTPQMIANKTGLNPTNSSMVRGRLRIGIHRRMNRTDLKTVPFFAVQVSIIHKGTAQVAFWEEFRQLSESINPKITKKK
eukprot:55370_1